MTNELEGTDACYVADAQTRIVRELESTDGQYPPDAHDLALRELAEARARIEELEGFLREMGLRRCTNCASVDLLKYCKAVHGVPPEYFGCTLWQAKEVT